MQPSLDRLQQVLGRYTGAEVAREVLEEQAAEGKLDLAALNEMGFAQLVDRIAFSLDDLVGPRVARAFRQAVVSPIGAVRLPRGRYAWLIVLLLLAATGVALVAGDGGPPFFALDLMQGLVSGLACGLLIRANRTVGSGDFAWLMIAVGMGLNTLAFLGYWWLEIISGQGDPFPSVADASWLLSNIALVFGVLAALVRLHRHGMVKGRARWGQTAAATLVCGSVLIASLIMGVEYQDGPGFTITLVYVGTDVAALSASLLVLISLMRLRRGWLAAPWRSVSLGLLATTISDLSYTILRYLGGYETGSLTDLGWLLQSLLMIWAAVQLVHLPVVEVREHRQPAA